MLALAATRLAACTPAELPDLPYITVERLEDATWRATFHLPAPVAALRFQRPAAFYREQVWEVLTPGYRLRRDGDWQTLELSEAAQPVSEIAVAFEEYTSPIPKEYELFLRFTAGGVAFYTGHLYAQPVGDAYLENAEYIRTLRLKTPAGAQAIVRGSVRKGALNWTDELGDGTYIYMGNETPIETDHLIAVVDRGIPEWLRLQLHSRLPELLAAYAERLGASLPWKPVVLYSFDDADVPGLSSGGGTLTGLIQLAITGSGWRERTPDAEEHAFSLLAHEAAHLWNGQLVESPGDGESWMHEGAADAMADDLLLELGAIDADRHREKLQTAINQCSLGLEGEPVNVAHRRGAFRVFYDCGHVMAEWTKAALRQVDPQADLYTFWRDLIAAAQGLDGSYDEDLYFDVLGEAGVPDDVRSAMRSFLSTPNAIAVAIEGLTASGLSVRAGEGTPPPDFQRELARRALLHLMVQACRRVSFRSYGRAFVTDAIDGCPPFRESIEIHLIEGHSVADEGLGVHDRVAERCRAEEPVRLQAEDGTRVGSVGCRSTLPSAPAWYELGP